MSLLLDPLARLPRQVGHTSGADQNGVVTVSVRRPDTKQSIISVNCTKDEEVVLYHARANGSRVDNLAPVTGVVAADLIPRPYQLGFARELPFGSSRPSPNAPQFRVFSNVANATEEDYHQMRFIGIIDAMPSSTGEFASINGGTGDNFVTLVSGVSNVNNYSNFTILPGTRLRWGQPLTVDDQTAGIRHEATVGGMPYQVSEFQLAGTRPQFIVPSIVPMDVTTHGFASAADTIDAIASGDWPDADTKRNALSGIDTDGRVTLHDTPMMRLYKSRIKDDEIRKTHKGRGDDDDDEDDGTDAPPVSRGRTFGSGAVGHKHVDQRWPGGKLPKTVDREFSDFAAKFKLATVMDEWPYVTPREDQMVRIDDLVVKMSTVRYFLKLDHAMDIFIQKFSIGEMTDDHYSFISSLFMTPFMKALEDGVNMIAADSTGSSSSSSSSSSKPLTPDEARDALNRMQEKHQQDVAGSAAGIKNADVRAAIIMIKASCAAFANKFTDLFGNGYIVRKENSAEEKDADSSPSASSASSTSSQSAPAPRATSPASQRRTSGFSRDVAGEVLDALLLYCTPSEKDRIKHAFKGHLYNEATFERIVAYRDMLFVQEHTDMMQRSFIGTALNYAGPGDQIALLINH